MPAEHLIAGQRGVRSTAATAIRLCAIRLCAIWLCAIWLCTFAAFLALAPPALAHSEFTGIEVERPDGADGPQTRSDSPASEAAGPGPAVVTLSFSEELDPGFARVEVRDDADNSVRVSSASVSDDRLRLEIELPSIPSGNYTIGWFIRSGDGDASNGSTRFTVGGPVSPSTLLPPIGARDPAWQPPMTWRMTSVSAMLRWFNYVGAALAVGALFFRAFVWPVTLRENRPAGQAEPATSMPGFRELIFAGLALLFLTNILLLLLQASFVQLATLQPVDTASPVPLGPSGLTQTRAANAVWEILGTWSGGVWVGRMALIVLMGVLLWRMPGPAERAGGRFETDGRSGTTGRFETSGRFVVSVAAGALLLLTISLSSHAAFVPTGQIRSALAVALDWTHLIAMTLWLGGLLPLLLALRQRRWSPASPLRRRLLHRFSPLALGAVSYLTVTGLAASYFQVGDPMLLLKTVYGVTLDVKLGLVGLLVGVGAVNRYVLIPHHDKGTKTAGFAHAGVAHAGFARTLPLEIALGSLLLVSVAVLASLGAASTSWPAHEALGLSQTAEHGDVRMTVRIAPGETGDNAVAVDVSDRRKAAWRTPGSLEVDFVSPHNDGSAENTDRTTAENTITERYTVPRLVPLAVGPAAIRVRLARPGYAPVEREFDVDVAAVAE